MSLSSGSHLGPYEILAPIGAGGMGEVYKARDNRLDRAVAIKISAAQFSERFEREARAVAALNHPHICTLYDVGPDYLVMEYLEGESLSARLARGALPLDQALEYSIQIAGALAHAHERGVLHRDLKCSNVMVSGTGSVKVLDFGLAKRFGAEIADETRTLEELTKSGTVVGTLAYMSPETLRGEPAEARSDLWALGVMLYEMVSGTRPFQGTTPYALTSAILREAAAPVPERVPVGLRGIIHKCLAKEPGERYQSAAEVGAALEAVSSVSAIVQAARVGSRRWILTGVAAVMAIVAAIPGLRWGRAVPGGIEAVAVLPFENLSKEPEQEFFADGMHEQLLTDLSKIRGLRVISRTSVMRYRGVRPPLPQIARELGVDAVVEGSVMRSGNKVRITAQLIRARTEKHLWAESYDRDLSEILALQRDVARTIAGEIQVTVTPQENVQLGSDRRVDPEVLQLVLRGQYWANKGGEEDLKKAVDYFQQAIARDPNYAQAHAGLANSYQNMATIYRPPREVMPKAKAAAQRALELDETLADAHVTLAGVLLFYDWDWPAAEEHLKRAVALSPNSAEAHLLYGGYFTALGRPQQALPEIRLAQALDPLSLRVQVELLFSLMDARLFDEVIAQAHRTLEREPNFGWGYAAAALAYAEKGKFDQAIEAIEKAIKIERNTTFIAFAAHVQAAKGDRREAEKLLAELKAVSRRRYVCAYEVAHAYVKLGDKEQAFQWLEKGKQERADCMVWLLTEPWMDPLRGDRRYRELIEHIGLTGKTGSKP